MRIGVTAGDPAGIGLEVLLRALPRFMDRAQWVLFGHVDDFRSAAHAYAPTLEWRHDFPESDNPHAGLWFHPTGRTPGPLIPGEGSHESGRRAIEALTAAADLARKGVLDGIVTAPLSKTWAGEGFIGQTEFLRDRAGSPHVAMSFFTPTFKVVLATTHVSLRGALERLNIGLYTELIALADRELRSLGYPQPRMAIAGINPHAGEGGLFGMEEQEILRPAVATSQASGFAVSGPWPADTCYERAHSGEFDVVIAPFHDQGLIPVKLIASGTSANVTLGLPYIRTSPDHGTAFDIAGRGVARIEGMSSAFEWALELVNRKRVESGGGPTQTSERQV